MTTLVVGGAASGKSEFAERLAESAYAELTGNGHEISFYYIATMDAPDEESERRIAKHRERREGKGYETVECRNAEELKEFACGLPRRTASERPVILLDDFGNLVANELFGAQPEDVWSDYQKDEVLEEWAKEMSRSLKDLHKKCSVLVLVSNDVFRDVYPWDRVYANENYLRFLGNLNIDVAEFADEVCEIVAGLPEYFKRRGDGT